MKIKARILDENTYEYDTETDIIEIHNVYSKIYVSDFFEDSLHVFKYRKLFLEFVLNEITDKNEFMDSSIKIQTILLKHL